MAFDNMSAFFQMGGYALFVWLAYGVSLFALGATAIVSIINRRTLFTDALSEMQRKQRIQKAHQANLSKESSE